MFKQRFVNFFKLLDANKNGVIDAKDAPALVKIFKTSGKFNDAQLTQIKTAIEGLIDGIIKAGGGADKKVTEDEWVSLAQQSIRGKAFADAPEWWKPNLATLFSAVDKDGNNQLSEDEYVNLLTGMVPAITADMAKAAYASFEGCSVSVDSGRAGFFDTSRYHDASVFGKEEVGKGWEKENTFEADPWLKRINNMGSFGYGDGAYMCLVKIDNNNKKNEIVAVKIVFINEDTTESQCQEEEPQPKKQKRRRN